MDLNYNVRDKVDLDAIFDQAPCGRHLLHRAEAAATARECARCPCRLGVRTRVQPACGCIKATPYLG